MESPADGWIGWIGVALVVIGWNGRCIRSHRRQQTPHEMLSEFAGRHRALFVLGALYLAFHFGKPKWMARYDPLHLAADWLCAIHQTKEKPC